MHRKVHSTLPKQVFVGSRLQSGVAFRCCLSRLGLSSCSVPAGSRNNNNAERTKKVIPAAAVSGPAAGRVGTCSRYKSRDLNGVKEALPTFVFFFLLGLGKQSRMMRCVGGCNGSDYEWHRISQNLPWRKI